MMNFTRQLVPLKPGEEPLSDLLIDLPEGFRLETDAEFRERISKTVAEHSDRKVD
jgi:hypothetical protein